MEEGWDCEISLPQLSFRSDYPKGNLKETGISHPDLICFQIQLWGRRMGLGTSRPSLGPFQPLKVG